MHRETYRMFPMELFALALTSPRHRQKSYAVRNRGEIGCFREARCEDKGHRVRDSQLSFEHSRQDILS